MSSIVGIIKQAILEGKDGNDLQLELFPELLPTKDFERVIFLLSKSCMEAKNGKALRDIISHFNQERASVDPLPTLTYLAYNPYINDSLLKAISSYFPEKRFVDYMNDIIPMLYSIEIALVIAKRWESILPPSTFEEWKTMKELSETVYQDEDDVLFTDKLLHDWINEKYNLIKSTVIPSWIRIKENLLLLEELIERNPYPLKNIHPNTKDAVLIILENLSKCAISYDNEFENTIKTIGLVYNISSSREKYALLYPNQDNTLFFDDIDYFTTCGPVNGHSFTAYKEELTCYYTGGCRLLTCDCHIDNEEEHDGRFQDFYDMECNEWIESDPCIQEEKESDSLFKPNYIWFTGTCDQCKGSIQRAEYALRIPLKEGGWKGCLCSKKCLSEIMKIKEDSNNLVLYTKLIEQLDTKGIYVSLKLS